MGRLGYGKTCYPVLKFFDEIIIELARIRGTFPRLLCKNIFPKIGHITMESFFSKVLCLDIYFMEFLLPVKDTCKDVQNKLRHKIPKFHLISWCWSFVEWSNFRRVLGELSETLRKLCLFKKFHAKKLDKILVFCSVKNFLKSVRIWSFSGSYFAAFGRIRRFSECMSVFSSKAGDTDQKKLQIRTFLKQWNA